MSIDMLHDKIRKLKNPSMVDLTARRDMLPPHLMAEEGNYLSAYVRFCRELMNGLKDTVPAVRFSFDCFAMLGQEGLRALQTLLQDAHDLGFYVLLNGPQILSPWAADQAAETFFAQKQYLCDGLAIDCWIGADAIKPFVPYCSKGEKDLFVMVRSANKSASDIQDLLTGTRLVHTAAADIVNRFADPIVTKCGYSRISIASSAGSSSSLRTLREGYKRMFLLVDGLDYPSGNAKNCSLAFDRFGYGAIVCAGPSVTAAWTEEQGQPDAYVQGAVQAAERMKRNLGRYISIL